MVRCVSWWLSYRSLFPGGSSIALGQAPRLGPLLNAVSTTSPFYSHGNIVRISNSQNLCLPSASRMRQSHSSSLSRRSTSDASRKSRGSIQSQRTFVEPILLVASAPPSPRSYARGLTPCSPSPRDSNIRTTEIELNRPPHTTTSQGSSISSSPSSAGTMHLSSPSPSCSSSCTNTNSEASIGPAIQEKHVSLPFSSRHVVADSKANESPPSVSSSSYVNDFGNGTPSPSYSRNCNNPTQCSKLPSLASFVSGTNDPRSECSTRQYSKTHVKLTPSSSRLPPSPSMNDPHMFDNKSLLRRNKNSDEARAHAVFDFPETNNPNSV